MKTIEEMKQKIEEGTDSLKTIEAEKQRIELLTGYI